MDVRDDCNPHRRRRTLSWAGVVAAAVLWAVAIWLLLDTRIPPLDLPRLDPRDWFTNAELERIEDYRRLPRWLWVGTTVVELAVLGLLAWQGSWIAAGARRVTRGRLRAGVLAALVCVLGVWLATLPIAGVSHWWRRRYGLSEQGWAAWLADGAVATAVLAVLVSIAVAGGLALAARWGRRWWVFGGAGLAMLGLVFVLLQPVAVEPLFNRFEPIADPALEQRVEALGERLGVDVGRVDVADASRRTTAANAVITGIGPTRRIALYDTLLDGRFTQDEIVVVAAHELGHAVRSHAWKGAAWFALLSIPGLAALAWIVSRRGNLGGESGPGLVPLALLVAFALSIVSLPAQNALSRRYEAEADWLALTATKDPAAAIGLVQGLAVGALNDPDPPRWSGLLLATHPSPMDRIAMALASAD